MTKEEYKQAKDKILVDFGEPSDPYDEPNESRTRLNKLKSEYLQSCRQNTLQEKKEKKALSGFLSNEDVKKYTPLFVGSVEVNEDFLIAFDDTERDIIRNHFDNWNLTHTELAGKTPKTSRQAVTRLLTSPAYKILESRVFDSLTPSEVKIALLAAVRSGDSKIIQRLAEHYKILNPEKMEIDLNKPIDDPLILKQLKELGDKAIDDLSKSKQ